MCCELEPQDLLQMLYCSWVTPHYLGAGVSHTVFSALTGVIDCFFKFSCLAPTL